MPGILSIVVFVLAVLGVCVWFSMKKRRKMAELEEARLAARQKALDARKEFRAVMSDVGVDPECMAALKAKVAEYARMDPGRADDLGEALDDAIGALDNAEGYEGLATKPTPGPTEPTLVSPDDANLAESVYNQMAWYYYQAKESARKAKNAVEDIDIICDEIQGVIDGIDSTVVRCDMQLETIGEKIEKLRELGFVIDDENQQILVVKTRLTELMAAERVVLVARELEQLEKSLNPLLDSIDQKLSDHQELTTGIPEAQEDLKALRLLRAEMGGVIEDLTVNHAKSSWKTQVENAQDVDSLLSEAEATIGAAKGAFTERLELNSALGALGSARRELSEAEELLRAVTLRREELRLMVDRAPATIETAKAAIAVAKAYCNQNVSAVDVEPYYSDANLAEDILADAEAKLRANPPNYEEVIAKAEKAEEMARGASARCKEAVAEAEALRQEVADALKQAADGIEEAQTYMGRHSGDIKPPARRKLEDAMAELDAAEKADRDDERLILARRVYTLADAALVIAKGNVRDAEHERERQEREERERRRAEEQRRANAAMGFGMAAGMLSRPRPSASKSPARRTGGGGFTRGGGVGRRK